MYSIVKMTQGNRTAKPQACAGVHILHRYSYGYYIAVVVHGMDDTQAEDKPLQAGESCNNCHAAFGRIFKRKVAN